MDRSNPSLGCTYFNQLSYRYVAGDADAILELDVTDDLRGQNGGVHAGITSVLADVAGAMASAARTERGGADLVAQHRCRGPITSISARRIGVRLARHQRRALC